MLPTLDNYSNPYHAELISAIRLSSRMGIIKQSLIPNQSAVCVCVSVCAYVDIDIPIHLFIILLTWEFLLAEKLIHRYTQTLRNDTHALICLSFSLFMRCCLRMKSFSTRSSIKYTNRTQNYKFLFVFCIRYFPWGILRIQYLILEYCIS